MQIYVIVKNYTIGVVGCQMLLFMHPVSINNSNEAIFSHSGW